MISEMALADSYALPFEFVPDTADRVNDLSRFYQHPTYGDMQPGHYSDDTQRSVANAMVILDPKGSIYSPLTYAAEYMATFARDPRPGYSRRYEAFLREAVSANLSPEDFCLRISRKTSNGSVMGVAVLGYLPTIEEVMLAAAAQAMSTHSYGTIPYAQIVALSAHYAINNLGKMADLAPWLYRHLHETGKATENFLADAALNANMPDRVTMGASSAVRLMLWALPRYNSLSALTKLAVEVGGDTDSAAAIMVAVASESLEYVDDFPDVLWEGLENGNYGRDYLRGIDTRLRALVAPKATDEDA